MEKDYPVANLISGWSWQVMLFDCFVLIVVVVETPSALLDSDRSSVPPTYIYVVEVVVRDATGNILPQGSCQFVSGGTVDHGTPNSPLYDWRNGARRGGGVGEVELV